jgi:hypothetical protein
MKSETWKTKDGQEILIIEMTDQHLANAISLLRKITRRSLESEIDAAFWASGFLQGEQALWQCEQDTLHLQEIIDNESEVNSIDAVAEDMFPKFRFLIEEQERRDLIKWENTLS